MKRFLFIALGILSLTSMVVLPLYVIFNIANRNDGFHYGEFTFVSILSLILIILIMMLVTIPFISNKSYPFYLSVFSLGYKKVYHSDLGVFYMDITQHGSKYKPGKIMISVFAQHTLYAKELFEIEHDGSMEYSVSRIKDKLEDLHKDILDSKNKIKSIEEWDGHFDKRSRRDHKISKILK